MKRINNFLLITLLLTSSCTPLQATSLWKKLYGIIATFILLNSPTATNAEMGGAGLLAGASRLPFCDQNEYYYSRTINMLDTIDAQSLVRNRESRSIYYSHRGLLQKVILRPTCTKHEQGNVECCQARITQKTTLSNWGHDKLCVTMDEKAVPERCNFVFCITEHLESETWLPDTPERYFEWCLKEMLADKEMAEVFAYFQYDDDEKEYTH